MWYESLLRHRIIPDSLIRAGIRSLLRKRLQQEGAHDRDEAARRKAAFIAAMKTSPLALHTREANEQHYEVPTDFYLKVLGHRLKYSSCLWPPEVRDLDAAELAMLDLTTVRAGIENGMDVLELGCGWGSLSLYLAARFPGCRITAVSNSRTQKAYIDGEAKRCGMPNLTVITADMNAFKAPATYDRVVSVEMFEHMRNYDLLLERVDSWLKPEGKLFVHIFVHDFLAYPFETDGDNDWMARYFFTGGLMPSFDIFRHFERHLVVEQDWAVNGQHYEKTLNAWLIKMDNQRRDLVPLFKQTYGKDWTTWWMYWRIFFMACAELFGFQHGKEWYVGHYLLRRKS